MKKSLTSTVFHTVVLERNIATCMPSFQYQNNDNWTGPGWSNGQYQKSVKPDNWNRTSSDLEAYSRIHDYNYAIGDDTADTDFEYARDNIGKDWNISRNIAGTAVGLQGLYKQITGHTRMAKKKNKTVLQQRNPKVVSLIMKKSQPQNRPKQPPRRQMNYPRKDYVDAPVARSYKFGRNNYRQKTQNNGDRMVISGSDYLTQITTSGVGQIAGDNMYTLDITPALFGTGSRLYNFASLYQFFDFKKLVFEFIPAATTSVTGQIGHYVHPDPTDAVVTGQDNIRLCIAAKGNDENSLWRKSNATMPRFSQQKTFYTNSNGSDGRLTKQGQYRFIAFTDLAANNLLGTIKCHYVIEYRGATLQQTTLGVFADGKSNLIATSGTKPFGTGTITDSAGTLAVNYNGSTGVLSLPNAKVGEYYFFAFWFIGSSMSGIPATNSTGATEFGSAITVSGSSTSFSLVGYFQPSTSTGVTFAPSITLTPSFTSSRYFFCKLGATAPITAPITTMPRELLYTDSDEGVLTIDRLAKQLEDMSRLVDALNEEAIRRPVQIDDDYPRERTNNNNKSGTVTPTRRN